MKRSIWAVFILSILAGLPGLASAELPSQDPSPTVLDTLETHWNKGIRFETRSQWLSLRFGGKVMGDVGWASGNNKEALGVDYDDRSQWRRLRPHLRGTIGDRLDFKIEGEFSGSGSRWTDLYLRLRDLPAVGSITAGHFKEPFGLEELTSSADTTFLERALPTAFAPNRSLGVMLHDDVFSQRATWSLGVFRSLNDENCFPNGRGGEACAITGRATWLPWRNEQGDQLLHVGGSYSFRSLREAASYRQRPEAKFVDYLTDTGSFNANRTHLMGLESAWVNGPISVQGEYMAASTNGPHSFLQGFYLQTSYFLTGEHRRYDSKAGVFRGPSVTKPFPTQGLGAWEVAARYSFLDLGDSGLPDTARQLQDMTIGLNWYLNPNTRIGFNYIHSCIEGPDASGKADVFLLRIQLVF